MINVIFALYGVYLIYAAFWVLTVHNFFRFVDIQIHRDQQAVVVLIMLVYMNIVPYFLCQLGGFHTRCYRKFATWCVTLQHEYSHSMKQMYYDSYIGVIVSNLKTMREEYSSYPLTLTRKFWKELWSVYCINARVGTGSRQVVRMLQDVQTIFWRITDFCNSRHYNKKDTKYYCIKLFWRPFTCCGMVCKVNEELLERKVVAPV
jgi:hypothetical protein